MFKELSTLLGIICLYLLELPDAPNVKHESNTYFKDDAI